MIEIEIIESPDPEILGPHSFYFQKLIFGRSKNSHLFIDDRALCKNHIRIEKSESGVLCQNMESKFYLSNGKKISGKKLHKIDDLIKIGETTLKIVSVSNDDTATKPSLSEKYNAAIERNPKLEELFVEIENEILSVEHDIHVKK
ncbi:MAG: hypothetical protein HN509_03035 [Halobacteriovoraceae bacterium]|jgi:hypothetical protein|nr:hypothetical protein [Halobacteriovoraceae bacterium]MBT5095181.1 hypothetical protein [Halobacteriovoraceae bacterium]